MAYRTVRFARTEQRIACGVQVVVRTAIIKGGLSVRSVMEQAKRPAPTVTEQAKTHAHSVTEQVRRHEIYARFWGFLTK